MKKIAAALGVAGLVAAGGMSTAMAQNMVMSMMQCTANCNTSYGQCLSGGTDMHLAMSPSEGMMKLQNNSQNAMSCASQLQACYSSCR